MNSEVMATYLKWGHRKNRIALTSLLAITMIVSLGAQSYIIYESLAKEDAFDDYEQVYQDQPKEKVLTPKDFELLFGANHQPEVAKQSADMPKTKLNLVLRGTLGERDQKNKYSSAIIQGNNQDKLYGIQDTLPGGAILREVHSDHVVLSRNGQLEILYFPDAGKDDRALQEFKSPTDTMDKNTERPGFTQEPDGKSLEQRMQELRDKLQQANQGI
ncbi:type II secretion system protein N [Endozoicomonas sp. 8E]|uniref:type II secretion system protein N n=1 Tax=Endozoicomonas sp. 8E TaxID=3035692 RepID=UPI002938F9A1|nr:type II secretion system protein N [Endozoicomonas sp. 8E]WOG29849.1 type II secretion system protein N [Endozoicomonas sp. 8E]